jgi:hypothetical protein
MRATIDHEPRSAKSGQMLAPARELLRADENPGAGPRRPSERVLEIP